MIVRFKRFTRLSILKRIGRELLDRFLRQFEAELNAQGIVRPAVTLDDPGYFGAWSSLLSAPDQLPNRFNEALFAIDEMSGPEGQEQLELALTRAEVQPAFDADSSREDMALQVWLTDPALLTRVHNRQRLRRLTTFEYFGTDRPSAERATFTRPDQGMLNELAAAMDPWFARHHRGHNTTRVELCGAMNGADAVGEDPLEFWFLVRHGDSFARTPKVEAQQTEILHFRPERDDVIVYSPHHDEIRINTRTKGERDLYLRVFGLRLRGNEEYFCSRRTYTLEPLRSSGPESLEPGGASEIEKIVLRELEIAWDNPLLGKTIREADDLFARPAAANSVFGDGIPGAGRLTRATFDVHFCKASRARPVQIRLPNVLKVGRHCDARSVDRWLCSRGFRVGRNGAEEPRNGGAEPA